MKHLPRPSLFSELRRRDLRTLLHPQKAIDRILAAAVRSTRADCGSFILINPNSGLLDIEASHGLSERAKRVKLRLGQGITGWVASTGKPLRTGDVRREKRYVALSAGVRSEMAVPVEMRGQVVGLLNVDSKKIDAFTEADEARLLDMAFEAAQWLELAWEMDQLRVKGRQLTSLVDIAQMIISETNLDEILEQINLQTMRLMKTRLSSVFLLNEDGSELVLRSSRGGTKLYREKPNLSMEDSLLGSVITRGKPVAVVDVGEEKRYLQPEIARRESLVSMLAVPLIFGEKPIGVLVVYTHQRHRFSNDEIKLLTTLGDLSAVAIEKGRLLTRVVDMEEKLRASERLSALGLLAAEIAHEIRNPLTVVQMLFHALMETLTLDANSRRDAQLIGEKMRQMNRILDQVLHFARSSEPIKELVRAEQVIDDVFLLTRHKLQQQGIEIRSQVPANLPAFRADRAQIEQVLLNLILNSAEAMPKGGLLRLSAALEKVEDVPYLALAIRDNGMGMSPGQMENLFAPFLTSKESGTGLGLAIVRKIMENHQSKVQVESKIGQGTKFKLLFPVEETAGAGDGN
jgi:signal transduction histidine kinase